MHRRINGLLIAPHFSSIGGHMHQLMWCVLICFNAKKVRSVSVLTRYEHCVSGVAVVLRLVSQPLDCWCCVLCQVKHFVIPKTIAKIYDIRREHLLHSKSCEIPFIYDLLFNCWNVSDFNTGHDGIIFVGCAKFSNDSDTQLELRKNDVWVEDALLKSDIAKGLWYMVICHRLHRLC